MGRTNARLLLLALRCWRLAVTPGAAAGPGSDEVTADPKRYSPPQTPDGQPDISGMWEPGPGRPMEKADAASRGSRRPAHPARTARPIPSFAPGDELPGGRATDRSPMIFDPADVDHSAAALGGRQARRDHRPPGQGRVSRSARPLSPVGRAAGQSAGVLQLVSDPADAGSRHHPLRVESHDPDHSARRPSASAVRRCGWPTATRAATGKATPWSST